MLGKGEFFDGCFRRVFFYFFSLVCFLFDLQEICCVVVSISFFLEGGGGGGGWVGGNGLYPIFLHRWNGKWCQVRGLGSPRWLMGRMLFVVLLASWNHYCRDWKLPSLGSLRAFGNKKPFFVLFSLLWFQTCFSSWSISLNMT